MNLDNLQCLLDVVEAGSFSQAARDHYVSQQALSDQIRRLEKYYQTPLLERTRPVRLTEAGKLVYETAKDVLATMEHLERQVARLHKQSRRLVISTGLVWTPPFLPPLIAQFQQMAPDVKVHLLHPSSTYEEQTSPQPGAELIVGNMPFGPGVEGTVLFQDTLSLVVSEELLQRIYGDRWRERDRRLRERAVLEDCSQLPMAAETTDRRSGCHIPGSFSAEILDDQDMVVYRCIKGLDAAIFPDHYARQTFGADKKIQIYPLYPDQVAFQVGIGARTGKPLSKEARLFIQVAKGYFQNEGSDQETDRNREEDCARVTVTV